MIRALTTLRGARRVAPEGPIVRLLDDPEELFIVGLRGGSSIMAVDPRTGAADGSIKVLDLMAGGPVAENDLRQGVTIGGHEVLDMVDARRGELIGWVAELAIAEREVNAARSGDLTTRRDHARAAAARLILIVDEIERELGS